MDRDAPDDLPAESRSELIAGIGKLLDADEPTAEDLVRSAEPLRDAMERAGGLVDSWGGGEFCCPVPRPAPAIGISFHSAVAWFPPSVTSYEVVVVDR